MPSLVRVLSAFAFFDDKASCIKTACPHNDDRERLDPLVSPTGFRTEALWTDDREWF